MTPELIFDVIAHEYRVPQAEILGKSHRPRFTRPRQLSMLCLRYFLGLSYPEISEILGKEDHTTSIHGVTVAKLRLAQHDLRSERVFATLRGAATCPTCHRSLVAAS